MWAFGQRAPTKLLAKTAVKPAGRPIPLQLFGRNLNDGPVIIAEIGVNHEGDIEVASRLIRLARETGADAVKFQSYTPERYISATDPERLGRVTRFALSRADHERLAHEARQIGIYFFSTAVSEDWVPVIATLSDVIKIASGDLTHRPVIRAAAQTGKQIILSVGLGTLEEIDQAVSWVREEVGSSSLADRLALLHCVTAYPTPIEEANVLSIPFLRDRYGLIVGYSNHVVGPEACYAAVALGAPIIEVHFTDRKSGRTFRDHALSMEPTELADLIVKLRRIHASLGRTDKVRQPSELANLSLARKGIVAARDLMAGTVLTADDVMFARPLVEFSSTEIERVVGRRLLIGLKKGVAVPCSALAV